MKSKPLKARQQKGEKHPHPAEMRERREYVRELMLAGNTRARTLALAIRNLYVTEHVAEAIYKEISKEIRSSFDQDLPDARPLQAARLQADLAKLREGTPKWRALRDKDGKIRRDRKGKPHQEKVQQVNYAAVAKHEAQLADILGTNEPIRVKVQAEVQVRTSLQAVIANLEPEDKVRLIEEAKDLERKAGVLPESGHGQDTVRSIGRSDGG